MDRTHIKEFSFKYKLLLKKYYKALFKNSRLVKNQSNDKRKTTKKINIKMY